ncbi:DUF6612 family protein [Alkalicoccus daliensis]|uniref:LppX_LprAFG lipoprotein n=1 Tax=Alkalicoccus daliensis TaxID=745820 RepID=A0A1H0GT72_9BACI|nr:DUF6612 family protein [Alkalicoccus daliensis]SDO09861.1 hypothetical protein SAMN04488053_10717 [Alkalicoccus daliensis]
MKKKIGLSIFSLLLLSACTGGSSLSAEEILQKSSETMEELASYQITSSAEQQMTSAEEEDVYVTTETIMHLTQQPLTFKEEASIQMTGGVDSLSYTSYFHEEEGLFIEDPMLGGWVQLPEEHLEEILAMTNSQLHPEEQLQLFQEYVSDVELETTEEDYIIHLQGETLELQEIMEHLGGAAMENFDEMMEMLEEVEINSFDFTAHIDKESYYQKEASIILSLTFTENGETMDMEQTTEMSLNNFNEIEEITIPEDVLNNAEKLDEGMVGTE